MKISIQSKFFNFRKKIQFTFFFNQNNFIWHSTYDIFRLKMTVFKSRYCQSLIFWQCLDLWCLWNIQKHIITFFIFFKQDVSFHFLSIKRNRINQLWKQTNEMILISFFKWFFFKNSISLKNIRKFQWNKSISLKLKNIFWRNYFDVFDLKIIFSSTI